MGSLCLVCSDGEGRNLDEVLAVDIPVVSSSHISLVEGVVDESQNIDTLSMNGTMRIHQSAEVLLNDVSELLDKHAVKAWEQRTSTHRRCIVRGQH